MDRRRTTRPQHILIADDSDELREMWMTYVTGWGFTAEGARNGDEALRQAQARRPDLVLMDLKMPLLDGLAATVRLRNDPATSDVPVVMLTADACPSVASQALDAGCDQIVGKPITPDELLCRLRAVLRSRNAPTEGDTGE